MRQQTLAFPHMEMLSKEQCETIHLASLEILEPNLEEILLKMRGGIGGLESKYGGIDGMADALQDVDYRELKRQLLKDGQILR